MLLKDGGSKSVLDKTELDVSSLKLGDGHGGVGTLYSFFFYTFEIFHNLKF